MKILQVCFRVPYPPHDGGAIAMYNMAKGFYEHGCDLTILSFNTVKHYIEEEHLPENFKKFGELVTHPLDATVKPVEAFLNLFTKKSYNISRFDNEGFHEKMKNLLLKNEYDIIHFEGLFTSMYVDTAREFAPKSKLVLRQHNVEHLIWERLMHESRFGKKQYLKVLVKRLKKYELLALKKFDAIIPITEVDAQFFKKCGIKKMFVSPTGVNIETFKADSTEIQANSIFHLGALNWMPNQKAIKWFVEEIWGNVQKEIPEAKFYIAGRDIPDWIFDYNNQGKNIEVVGEVTSAVDFMNSKSIMVVPLKSGSGMRIKIVEGMALGKPIVSTSIGAEGIEYTHQKNILIADSKQDFVKELVTLLQNQQKQEEIGKEAIQLVQEKYSNYSRIGDLLAYYQKIKQK